MTARPSTPSGSLAELAALVGILPEYHDIWGARHATGDATRRGLLAAMGLAAATPAAVAKALESARRRRWHQALPPVRVEPVGEAPRLEFVLPEHALDRPHRWRLRLEDGGTLEADFHPLVLDRLDLSRGDGETMLAVELRLPILERPGYHSLEILREDTPVADMPLIVHPRVCYQPAAIRDGGRVWGLATQLYSLRARDNWGMGDYRDLRRVVEWAAQAGAALVGVNPLHALFPHNPRHTSPYSPSSRQYFNVLCVSVEELPELAECPEAQELLGDADFQARLAALRATPLVDYAGVGEAKYALLEILYRHFRSRHLTADSPRAQDFRAYQREGGEDLRRFALYHALQEHFSRRDPTLWGWPVWPAAYRDPDAPAVRAYAEAHPERVEWIQWLQWLADRQLAAVGRRSYELGLGVGLYQDLAVGVDKGGAEVWMHQDLYALEAKVGCPPDDFNPQGQDWGLPPWVPQRLRAVAYAPFIAMLRANMKYAGALRIDHVMGLLRLFWVPAGLTGQDGAYLLYPFRELLGILALESQRNRCLIVGEDLGTVPDAVRHALAAAGVLSYKLLYFERQADGNFQPPAHYPAQALLAAATHDLATLTGYWRGLDLDLREQLDLYPSEALQHSQRAGRAEDRFRLLRALAREGLLPDDASHDPEDLAAMGPSLIRAIHRYLARSPARIVLVQAEDLLGEAEQANLPGTVEEHPNWRRKLSLPLEDWWHHAHIRALAEAMTEERGRGAY